ncbi:MAG: FecR domain-containing protein [Betaproteobacteria bacterium]|mgnify:CR=1 FL=1|jgi:hypothetical protein|nr:FecR domain-containing protein [Betaproteobacteria bacterium]HMV21419.1 FecR domain-containing protein [Rhodocyclaceae bacterium]HMW77700.1 FecR domain-containing protein [Rhodocyclaceae bacterium]HNE43647.1 FecR domain-containing protein [Rhodocyclaceae bacterium]HNM22506.1 FecR domain-containing protein [Rhodocyclaceae bacterium]
MLKQFLVGLATLTAAGALLADAPIGYVKTVSGSATVTTADKVVKAEVGTPVFLGSVLQTGKSSSLGLTLKDETIMSFGSDTQLTVDEYLYAPAEGKLKLNSRLARGSLNYVSGVIAKLQPDAVTVKTPSGVIGVRGTQFLLKVDPE